MMQRKKDIECFYRLLARLEKRVGGKRTLNEFATGIGPRVEGVYFFFEPGEYRSNDSEELRVVRVGTHGSSERSSSTIWTRLFEHKMDNGRSVFRDHVRIALRNRSNACGGSACTGWKLERCVSKYIGKMPFLWLKVDNHDERDFIESNAIAMLSNYRHCDDLIDKQSEKWLGKHRFDPHRQYNSPRIRTNAKKVASSGLWNVNYVNWRNYKSKFLTLMGERIKCTPTIETGSFPCVSPSVGSSLG